VLRLRSRSSSISGTTEGETAYENSISHGKTGCKNKLKGKSNTGIRKLVCLGQSALIAGYYALGIMMSYRVSISSKLIMKLHLSLKKMLIFKKLYPCK
jgi:hypothetical protein